MKILLIGEAPSKNEPDPKPLEGRIGRRLAACANLTFEQYLDAFDRTNLLDVRQDNAEHGFTFDQAAGRKAAQAILDSLYQRTAILLGKRVAGCFGAISKPLFEPYHLRGGVTLYVVPHTSGINR